MVLTQKDLNALQELIGVTIDEKLEKVLDEKLKHFPNKEEFFSRMDEMMKELKDMREETSVLGHQVQRNADKIEKIESRIASIHAS